MNDLKVCEVEVFERCFVCGEEKSNVEDCVCEDCYAEIETWKM